MLALGIELFSRTKIFIPFPSVNDFISSTDIWGKTAIENRSKKNIFFIKNPWKLFFISTKIRRVEGRRTE
jgi:hypothetical protein